LLDVDTTFPSHEAKLGTVVVISLWLRHWSRWMLI
jgi:hypothetical protein